MTGLLTKVDRPLMRGQGRFDPNLLLDMPFVPSASIRPFRGTATTFSRSSVAYCRDSIGNLWQALADVPCFDHDPADSFAPLGVLIEGQSTNEIRNNTMAGAEPTTDTLPPHWSLAGAGPAMSIEDSGTESGMEYVDIRFNGTANNSSRSVWTEDAAVILAVKDEVWTFSTYAKLIAGSFANVNNAGFRISEYNSTPSEVAWTSAYDNVFSALGSTAERFAGSKTLSNVNTASIRGRYYFKWAASGAVDFTIRLYLPQCEKQPFATSPVKTGSVAVTRNAGILTSTLAGFPSAGAFVCVARAPGGSNAADATLFHAEASTSANRLQVIRRANDNPRVEYRTAGGAATTVDVATAWADDSDMRIAVGWDEDRVQMSLDQAAPAEGTHTGVVFDEAPSALSFGHDKALTAHLGGHLKSLHLFNTPFFGAALQAL